jgi:hypothetical protein
MSFGMMTEEEYVLCLALPESPLLTGMTSNPQSMSSIFSNPVRAESMSLEELSELFTVWTLDRDLDIEMSFQMPAKSSHVLPRPSQNGHITLE